MAVWFVMQHRSWLNPLICGQRGALGARQRCVNWNLYTTSEIWRGPYLGLLLFFFTHLPSTLSHCSHTLFFSNRVRLYRVSSVSNAIGCEISEGEARGNHSISCAHLARHLYRRAGGFWKGEKSFTKSKAEASLTQTDSGHISHNVQPLLSASVLFSACVLCAKPLPDYPGSFARSIYNIKK